MLSPLDLYVARRPPSTDHFLSQRIRQAYDDFAIPARMGAWLALGPLAIRAARREGGARRLIVGAATSIALAELGRRRAGGAARFPASGSLLAPVWLLERSLCAWLALWARLRGGVPYGGGRLSLSATSPRVLRARHAGALAAGDGAAAGSEADRLVGAVAERADL